MLTRRLHDELGLPEEDAARFGGAVLSALEETTGAEDLYRRVADQASLPPGKARELAQVVCRVLGEELDEASLAHLGQWLPGDVLALLDLPAPTPPMTPRHTASAPEHTLSGGRPGSRHPLSEAAPGHYESVAISPDPHADTKLSSGR